MNMEVYEGNDNRMVPLEPFENVEIHPLLIEHILDKIFRHIIEGYTSGKIDNECGSFTRDIRSFRLVCKVWQERATIAFRSFCHSIRFGTWGFYKHTCPDLKLTRFLDAMGSSQLIPVQRYSIENSVFVQCPDLLQKFMRLCLADAIEFKLSICEYTLPYSIGIDISGIDLKNMRILKVKCGRLTRNNSTSIQDQISFSSGLVEQLLEGANLLQEFTFELSGEPGRDAERMCVEMFARIPSTLTRLQLRMRILFDLHFEILAERNLKLEHCEILRGPVVNTKGGAVRRFLQAQAPTLQTLRIFLSGSTCSILNRDFSQFGSLVNLDLRSGGATLPPQKFSEIFPSLSVLNIYHVNCKTILENLVSSGKPVISVKELFLPCSFPLANLIRMAADTFPNTRILHLSQTTDTKETLQEVYLHFFQVGELSISFATNWRCSANGDTLLSGMSEEDRERNNLEIEDVLRRQPSILNLTKLRKLILDCCASVPFTDFSVRFLLSKMESLEELHADYLEMSPDSLFLLRNQLKVFKVKFSDEEAATQSTISE